MVNQSVQPRTSSGGNEHTAAHSEPIWPSKNLISILLFFVCLAAQLYLVFWKSFNWDEFLHYNYVYQIKSGTLNLPFQVVHLRLFTWASRVSVDLLNQMVAARILVWGLHLATLGFIFMLARKFTDGLSAFFSTFAYLTAGYVFTQSFSIRVDPIVTATLMLALLLMAQKGLSTLKAIAIGALIGLAGMMTFKAAFYAPCLVGLAWLKFRESTHRISVVGHLALIGVAALLSFAAVYHFHTADFAKAGGPLRQTSSVSLYARWLTFQFQFAGYVARELILALAFFGSIILAPRAWKKTGLDRDRMIALIGFLAPLVTLLFYRNTFPYLFTFLLAPVAVAIGPSLGMIRERYGSLLLSFALAAPALTSAYLEPRDMIARQRALVSYVHREFPKGTDYLDYSGMISDYPRILKFLTSGNGMRYYRETGDPVIGRAIDEGRLPFIIANQEGIEAALNARQLNEGFLPGDLAALNGNYVRQWGVLWREGKQIPAGAAAFAFEVRHDGTFVLDGDDLTIDGVELERGSAIRLSKGLHAAGGNRLAPAILWRGERLPTAPPNISMDRVFTNY